MSFSSRAKGFNIVSNWLVVSYLVGFLFIGTVPKVFGLTEGSFTYEFRLFLFFISFYFVSKIFFDLSKSSEKNQLFRLFILFWIIYGYRIIHDLYINPIQLYENIRSTQYFQFSFGVCFIPCLAVYSIQKKYGLDYEYILSLFYRVLVFSMLIAVYYRLTLEITGRTTGDINIGVISFGNYGATLCLLSIFYILTKRLSLFEKIFYGAGSLLGFSGIVLSGSKSPFLGLITVLVLYIYLWYDLKKSFFYFLLLGVISYTYIFEVIDFTSFYLQSNFAERLFYMIESGQDEVRETLLKASFHEFLQSPILGNAFLIQNSQFEGSYPHNSIVESLMATGAIGGGVFILLIWKVFTKAIKLIKNRSSLSWISFVFLQYLIFSFFSSNLYSNQLFWILLVLVSGINTNSHRTIIDS